MGYLAFAQTQNGCGSFHPGQAAHHDLPVSPSHESTPNPIFLTIFGRLLNRLLGKYDPKKDVSAEEALPLFASSSSFYMRENGIID